MDGAIRFTGPDAHAFLQGQLTQDVQLLSPDKPLLAAHCTPQGRVVAVLELTQDSDGILARLPASMVEPLIAKLKRYVLRAKVTMANANDQSTQRSKTNEVLNAERLEKIAAGRPQIYPETSEAFVAQMLNLDLLDGISFSKGCYTGQEIVARAHYRGKVKRRMQRFRTLEALELTPGAQGRLTGGRGFKVVQAALLTDGRCEFLAVAPLQSAEATPEDESPHAESSPIAAEALPLPYVLPQ